jgi:zinc transporter
MTSSKLPDGFAFGFKISQDGKATPLPRGIHDGGKDFWVWIALDPKSPAAAEWLHSQAAVDPQVANALIAFDTRPRCLTSPHGALLILRGVNFDPNSDPTDLVSIRIWIEDNRVVTVQHRQLATVDALRAAYDAGKGPDNTAQFIVALGEGLNERMRTLLGEFEEEIDRLEDESIGGDLREMRRRLNRVRHSIVPLRRNLAPQRDAFVGLMQAKLSWVDDWWQSHLRELTDEVHRFIEQMDAIRETANIVQDTLNARIAEDTNKLIVLLSIGAAAFLPLNLFVGLLGVNLPGIPGAQSPYGFWGAVGLLVLILLVEYGVFRWLRLWRLLR